ncbi:MAG: pyruvate kinase [Dehalococcoidia bacterium]|nr:pyruvate kinase [Dehalococcoidia bacterium]MCB9485069.1 pyruvate kinase [Thermoflexaceae bacterium]
MTRSRRTKIVCTLGPASRARETIAAIIDAGMDVARLNTSHGTPEEHLALASLVREVAKEHQRHIGVLMDLGGPKLRTGDVADEAGQIALIGGQRIALEPERVESTAGRIGVDYPRLCEDVGAGERVLVDDGAIALVVESVEADALICRVTHGGTLTANRGVSLPDSKLTLPALTDRDRHYIALGVESGIDFFALSFVGSAADVSEAKSIVGFLGAETPVIAKIERRQAIEHLDEIAMVSDGLMVARGDLGVELPPESVPVQQRRIIAAAAERLIPVITATQMLESMTNSPRPTRAESSDVAHAVWDLSDAVMLSGETAAGRYPVESVAMMDRIVRAAEEAEPVVEPARLRPSTDNHAYVVALAARQIVESDLNMRGVVCFTRSGYTALLLSKVHPDAEIYGLSPTEGVCRQLALARGVTPILVPFVEHSEEMLQIVDSTLSADGMFERGDEAVVVASLPVRAAGRTNFLKLHRVGETAGHA